MEWSDLDELTAWAVILVFGLLVAVQVADLLAFVARTI